VRIPVTLTTFLRRVRDRRVIPWTLAYLAGAWIALEAVSFMVSEFNWPGALVPFLAIGLGFGTLFTITIAWCHGEAGWQRVTRREVAVYVVLGAATLTGFWQSTGRIADAGEGTSETAPLTRVAVLYVKAGADELAPLAADLTEALTHRLSQVPALQVLSLQDVAPFRDSPLPLDTITARLRVGALVESSIVMRDDSMRLTVQLLDAHSGERLGSWARNWPARPTAALLNELTALMSERIRTRLGQEVRERTITESARSELALALYTRAQVIIRREAPPAGDSDERLALALLEEADDLLAQAEAADPGWVWPILLRADAADLRSRYTGGAGARDLPAIRDAIDHATRALGVGADSALVLERRATHLLTLARYSPATEAEQLSRDAETDMRAALRLDPDRPGALQAMSNLSALAGNHKTAYEFAGRAYLADSFMERTEQVIDRLVGSAVQLEQFDDAAAWYRRGRALHPRSQGLTIQWLVALASMPDPGPAEVDWAWAAVDTLVAQGLTTRRDQWLAYGNMLVGTVLAGAGMPDSADVVMRRAGAAMRRLDAPRMRAAASLFEAHGRLRLGQRDSAVALLADYARQLPAEAGQLKTNWWFREIHGNPDFLAICCALTESAPTYRAR
jgi:TolB-like protein